jgi:hypothetical protein
MRRKLTPVRLTEVPLKQRRAAARHLCQLEIDPLERLELMYAAERPSNRAYWIVKEAA